MDEHDVRGQDLFGEFFELLDFFHAMPMNGRCETQVTGTEMNLHNKETMGPVTAVGNGKRMRRLFLRAKQQPQAVQQKD